MQEEWSILMQAMVTARTLIKQGEKNTYQRISFPHRGGTPPLWNSFEEFKYMICYKILRKRNKKLGECSAKKGRYKTKHHPTLLWRQNQTFIVSYCFHFIARKQGKPLWRLRKDHATVESKINQRGICKCSEFFSLVQMGMLALLIRE